MKINWEFIREVGAIRWLWRTLLRQSSKRILRRDNHITLPTGARMVLPRTSKFASEVFITRCHVDWGSEALFARHLNSAGVFLDVGANIGYYSLYMLPLVATIHAFEPDLAAHAKLRKNLALYTPRATAHAVAVGKMNGIASFVTHSDSEISHLVQSASDGASPTQQVPITTIDQFVADFLTIPQPQIVTGIKIDVEGADFQVLEGARNTLATHSPLVLAETSPDARLFEFLQPHDYRVFAFTRSFPGHAFQLQAITASTNLPTKMLFLVPPRLSTAFQALASNSNAV